MEDGDGSLAQSGTVTAPSKKLDGLQLTSDELVYLVKRLPSSLSDLVDANFTSLSILGFKTCYVELRAAALVLFPISVGELGRLGLNVRDDEKLTPQVVSDFTASVEPVVAQFRDAKVEYSDKKLTMSLRKPGTFRLSLRFHAETKYTKWSQAIRATISAPRRTLADYEALEAVGKGASGRVFLVRDKTTNERLALKAIEKASIFQSTDTFRHALDERLAMQLAGKHPFVLNLRSAFQSRTSLYLVTEFCPGGDLFDYLRRRGKPLSERHACRVAAQVLSAIQHIHSLGVIYRDLKLENVLLDASGHVRVADFGLSKIAEESRALNEVRASSFCGTREYVSPEMLAGGQYGQSVDLWACGILFYEILCGRTPFYAATKDEVYDQIENAPLKFPRHLSADVVSLIRRLLDRNPATRLGVGPNGLDEVKRHSFFRGVDWEALHRREPHPDDLDIGVVGHSVVEGAEEDLKFLTESAAESGKKQKLLHVFRSLDHEKRHVGGYSFWEQLSAGRTTKASSEVHQDQPRPPAIITIRSGELELETRGISSMSGLLRPLSRQHVSKRTY